ncbi:longitudinals lacking protein, isoforms A/B/D/L-like [Leptopilina boulardi]|uniref:longitudinals lacking protein, isoforms A/B/D/L-like n=1 Tax=Leptopilina boulardi TaxID=63433 RepID=UPI0021F66164|nr:longitudinals lacking protein, isoforms A/B/D/L-like [Leptopilina boulardi]
MRFKWGFQMSPISSSKAYVVSGDQNQSTTKFPCPGCPSVFSQKSGLVCHQRFECGQKPHFKCPYCEYVSKKSSNIQKHVRRKHQGCPVSYLFI